jgi:hypothetical protein
MKMISAAVEIIFFSALSGVCYLQGVAILWVWLLTGSPNLSGESYAREGPDWGIPTDLIWPFT